MDPEPSAQAARAAGLFDALSTTYDAVGVDFFQPIAAGLVDALDPSPGERWLDVGCGRGAVLLPAARRAAPGAAVGLDISPAMVASAQELARQHDVDVEVLVDDAQSPTRVDGPFDVVSSSLVLFFLADPLAALVSWRSLLRPGGRLGVTTFGGTDPRWAAVDELLTAHLPEQARDARTTGAQGPFASSAGMEQLVRDAGYADVRTIEVDLPVRFADAQRWYDFSWSTGQRAMWLAVPEAGRAQVRAEAERRLLAHADADGSVTFVQPVRHTLAVRP